MRLPVDEDELASCVSCGLCLPHCPTFRVSGDETRSPRGRIAAMRAVHAGAPIDDSVIRVMDECVLCRGCEPACPSGVPFGRLMESTRHALATEPSVRYQPWWRRLGYRVLERPRLLAALTTGLAVAQRLRAVPSRLGLPDLPVRQAPLEATGDDVWLFTGCVMDAWMRSTHRAVLAVLSEAGVGVALPGPEAACCGALHSHAGLRADAQRLARRVVAAMPGPAPVLVDSAGCGAALRDYGELLGTPAGKEFAARVTDVHEWLAARMGSLPASDAWTASGSGRLRVAVQDPCHLRHVQRAEQSVRHVLAPYVDVVELDDDGLCCGAGGAYSVQHPELSGAIRERKVAAIRASGAAVVASANPGCIMHLRAGGVDARYPLELVAEAIGARNVEV